jgi:hypothetical protein
LSPIWKKYFEAIGAGSLVVWVGEIIGRGFFPFAGCRWIAASNPRVRGGTSGNASVLRARSDVRHGVRHGKSEQVSST